MSRKSLIAQMRTDTGLRKVDAEKAVDNVTAAIGGVLKKGGDVSLRGFGRFFRKHQADRVARNPRTGEKIAIPAREVVKFKADDGLI